LRNHKSQKNQFCDRSECPNFINFSLKSHCLPSIL
jgi:hypothetical protein